MMRTINLLTVVFMLCLLSCQQEKHEPLFVGGKPAAIADYTVENLPGGAKITCRINDDKTLYVKAVYTVKEGLTRVAKASKYNNTLLLNGFPKSGDYQVAVYAVGSDEEESDPVEVTVHPSTPPYIEVHNNLQFTADYGGGFIQGVNAAKANLVIGVITKDSSGKWEDVTDYFSSSEKINFSFRGFPPEEREFGLFVRDEWQNYSDTTFETLTPWEEIQIDMSDFQETVYPGDALAQASYPLSKMFNGVTGSWSNGYYSQDGSFPMTITIYLQGTYQLSRFKLWQNSNLYYQSSNPKHFKVWGSMSPNPNGKMDSTWYLLGEFDNWKPSGTPPGELTDEDVEQAEAGNEFVFARDVKPAKYIRIETLDTWQPRTKVYFVELAFWGRGL